MFWDNTYRLTNELRGRGSLEVRTEQHLWRVTFHGDMGELGGEFRLSRRQKRASQNIDWPTTFPADPAGMRQVIDALEEAEMQAGGDPRRWQIHFPAAPDLELTSWTVPWQFDENHALAQLFEDMAAHVEDDDEEEEDD
jgi:hypothetical protein